MTNEELVNALLESDFDNDNFDANLEVLAKKNPAAAIKMAMSKQGGAVRHIGAVQPDAALEALIVNSKGDLNVRVTRESITIAKDLPYVIFGKNDFDAKYISTIKPFLPAGVLLNVSVDATTGDVLFTYTEGGNTDIIRLNVGGNTNYTAFLSAMSNNYFKSKLVLITISDKTKSGQFGNEVNFGTISSLGKAQANQIDLDGRILPGQFRDDRVAMVMPEQSINNDFAFIQNFGQYEMFQKWHFFMSDVVNLNKRL